MPELFIYRSLVPNPLHVLEEHFLAAAIIKLGGPAVGVAGDALSRFKGAVISEKIRDAGRPERVGRLRLDESLPEGL
jgi:hypothetical protein